MFDPREDKSGIDEIKKSLYSRDTDAIFAKKRHSLKPVDEEANTDWSDDDLRNESDFKFPYVKILLGALIFFLLTAGFAAYRFFGGSNLISGDNINILVRGPVSVAGGEILPLDIEVQNKNSVDLKVVDLKIEYPDGTRDTNDLSLPLDRYSEVLGDINVGKSERRLVKAVLFGEENTQKDIKITVEYRVSGSNAIFYKEKTYQILISSAPVNLIVVGPEEVNANQKAEFDIEVVSNSLSVIKNLTLKIDYPFGFNFISAIPGAFSIDNSVWKIGDLGPGAKRNIKLSGSIEGQDGEERMFRFTVGTPDRLDEKSIQTPFSVYTTTLLIKKPFMGVNLAINNNQSKEVVVKSGEVVRAALHWQNNLPSQIYDASIQIKLRGGILDKSSIQVERGFYSSIDNSITFDKKKDSSLSSIDPGSYGDVNFLFSSFSSQSKTGSSFNNPEIYMDINVMGKRAQGENVPQELLYSDSKRVKIASVLKLSSLGFRSIGPFENMGPIPPKAEEETTYTITWTATNIFNDVSSTKVSATLPPYVKWNNLTSPLSEKITFDETTGQVVWDLGNVRSGTGLTLTPREASFHISIIPSLSQVDTAPEIVSQTTISGTDSFTNTEVGETKPGITTEIKNDPSYKSEDGKVIK